MAQSHMYRYSLPPSLSPSTRVLTTFAPAYVPDVKINLPNFLHMFNDIPVDFGSIEVFSHNATVRNNGLRAEDFLVNAENTPISGFFNVTHSLKLVTKNAPIEVTVEAYHTLRSWHRPTNIHLVTSNALLTANLSLFNTTEHSFFRVSTKTSNAPSDVEILSSPIGGYLRVGTHTSNAEARLALDAAYEGVYAAVSSNAELTLERREGVEDPTGAERERVIETNRQTPRGISGNVYWGAPKHHRSSIAGVVTSNKPAKIVL